MPPTDLRIPYAVRRGDPFDIDVNGERVVAYPGETIAAALLAAGKYCLRTSRLLHSPRGLFCGMGICYECRMIVNGQPNVPVCITLAQPGCRVQTQEGHGVKDTDE
jgi:aerobic-type carbon monoxide dehydrogenase small subunit (CoxS/CutS family)